MNTHGPDMASLNPTGQRPANHCEAHLRKDHLHHEAHHEAHHEKLREGFTTGSAAAAAARAATLFALTGQLPRTVDIPLPPPHEGRLTIAIADAVEDGLGVRAAVVKDGGDDPDATDGARIEAVVTLDPAFSGVGPHVLIGGGRGVGVATLPGLPVPVGSAAINPGPTEQIRRSVLEVLPEDFKGVALVFIEAPQGEEIARHTLNPRLGITGGISILGTGGIVRPYSHTAWAECVRRSLDVAKAAGQGCAVLTTGRRSERFFQERFPFAPDVCLVQAADFFAEALQDAAARGFACVVWSVFFGKLAKQAQGFANTHAREAALDFALLAAWAREAGADAAQAEAVARANTAAHALALVPPDTARSLTALLVAQAKAAALRHLAAGRPGPVVDARPAAGLNSASGPVADVTAECPARTGQRPAESAPLGQMRTGDAGADGPESKRAGLPDVRYVVFGLEGGLLYADDVPEVLFSPVSPLHPGAGSR